MYLSKLKIWNFRKFGSIDDLYSDGELRIPDLECDFQNGLNALIGENDSGKTAIIDAIKLILKTHSVDWITLDHDDFYSKTNTIRIECRFDDLSPIEAKNFTEWLGCEGNGEETRVYLKVILIAYRKGEKIIPYDIKAGADDFGSTLNAEAKEYLKTAYLRPLRDAKKELIPKKNSRLSQILQGHEVFKGKELNHEFLNISLCLNCLIQKYFNKDFFPNDCPNKQETCLLKSMFYPLEKYEGVTIKDNLDGYLNKFFGEKQDSEFSLTEKKLKEILSTLKLTLDEENLGLGSHNLLFIATELLNLERSDWDGLRLGLIEELEAHLHPQAQMRVVEFLQDLGNKSVQLILTTHSPNLASKVNLDNLILCANNNIGIPNTFSLRNGKTQLSSGDYRFLERFLDVTKSNLFFAKGVILVEGWAEELIIPTLAKKIGINLADKGVSIINVGSTAFLRYARIFQRTDDNEIGIPVSVITDLDLKPDLEELKRIPSENGRGFIISWKSEHSDNSDNTDKINLQDEFLSEQNTIDDYLDFIRERKKKNDCQSVKTYVSPYWTLEYCIARSPTLAPILFEASKKALKEMRDNGQSTYGEINEDYSEKYALDNQESIALDIYKNIILGKKISKAIIAQQFTELLESDNSMTEADLLSDNSIKYLIQAIKNASNEA